MDASRYDYLRPPFEPDPLFIWMMMYSEDFQGIKMK